MRLALEHNGNSAELKGLVKPLTTRLLAEILLAHDNGSPSFDPRLIENGGEAAVRLIGSVALRFEHRFLSGRTSKEAQEKYVARLRTIAPLLPTEAIKPLMPLVVDNQVVGHTMDFAENFVPFKALFSSWSVHQALKSLAALHQFIEQCHTQGLTLGELNPQNFGYSSRGFTVIDTLGFGYGHFACSSVYRSTVDPVLLPQDLTLLDPDPSAWTLSKPQSTLSDWFGFTCIVCEALLGIGPWSGVHINANEKVELRRLRVRAIRSLSLLHPDISLDKEPLLRSPECLPEDLYEFLYMAFNHRVRSKFPLELLSPSAWRTCARCHSACGARVCPCEATKGIRT
jgi:hypothetical protein